MKRYTRVIILLIYAFTILQVGAITFADLDIQKLQEELQVQCEINKWHDIDCIICDSKEAEYTYTINQKNQILMIDIFTKKMPLQYISTLVVTDTNTYFIYNEYHARLDTKILKTSPNYAVTNKGDLIYIDQYTTGKNASVNCTPTSTAMIMTQKGLPFTDVQQVRKGIADFHNTVDGQGQSPSSANAYLQSQGLTSMSMLVTTVEEITDLLDQGYIALMSYNAATATALGFISTSEAEYVPHASVITGYAVTDDKVYFEVQNPSSYQKAVNGFPYGKSQIFDADELLASIIERGQRMYFY